MKASWVTLFFVGLADSSSRLRQKLWQWVYDKIAAKDKTGKFVFMNYGYEDEKNLATLRLNVEDEPFRYFIQLYNFVVNEINLEDKNIVEVGCGRGGGGSFLVRYKNPQSYTGIDLSETAINWCKQRLVFANAKWMQGYADALPIANNSVDVVINVESSHCYPSMEKFLSEVKRTLKPNGYFAFCDLRRAAEINKLEQNMTHSGLKILKQVEITPQVLRALDHVSQTREQNIQSVFPPLFRRAVRDFAAIKDTVIYEMLKDGRMKYFFYLMQKEENI